MGGDTIKYLTCNSDAFRVTKVFNAMNMVNNTFLIPMDSLVICNSTQCATKYSWLETVKLIYPKLPYSLAVLKMLFLLFCTCNLFPKIC